MKQAVNVQAFRAWAFVCHAKVNQTYGGKANLPYTFHLECVHAQLVRIHPARTPVQECVAYGHDLMEDARITYNDVKDRWGEGIAEGIYACTELRGRNRFERHGKEYTDGLSTNADGLIVKLADIAANASYSKLTGSTMYAKYREEWPLFSREIGAAAEKYGYGAAITEVDRILDLDNGKEHETLLSVYETLRNGEDTAAEKATFLIEKRIHQLEDGE